MSKRIMSVFGSSGRAMADETSSALDTGGQERAAAPGSGPSPERTVMILGKTLAFKGELWAEEDLILLGRVEGTITHTASITVGIGGTVVGDIEARFVTVKGTVEGDIYATELVVVTPTGCVLGDITAPRVGVVEGARLTGAVRMPVASSMAAVTEAEPPTSPSADTVLDAKAVERVLEKN